MPLDFTLQTRESADMANLLHQSDAYMAALYPAESNHMVPAAALLSPGFEFYLCNAPEGAVAGCCGLALKDGYGEVKRMYLHPHMRGRGYGRAMLGHLARRAKSLRLPVLRLEVGIHQPEALALYAACGFKEVGPFGEYFPDPLSLFYEKTIT